MKITACKERKLPLCPRHCRVGLAKGAITIPKAMYKAGKSGHKPSATGKQGGLMDAVSWRLETAQNNPSPMDFKLAGEMYSSRPEQVQGGGLYTCLARKNKNL